jgi:hypothetical protein
MVAMVALIACTCGAACGGRVVAMVSSKDGGAPEGDAATANPPGVDGAGATNAVDAGVPPVRSPPLPRGFPAPDRSLSSLDEDERRALCLEDARRSDACLTEGLTESSEADCSAAVEKCRSTLDPAAASADCAEPRDLSDCGVTVGQFFACVDAWNATQSCVNAGIQIDTPGPCQAVSECTDFRFAFTQSGRPPRCDPAVTPAPPRPAGDDVYGAMGCRALPKRFVTLGNSIGECEGPTGCAQSELHAYLSKNYAPDLTYEKHTAFGGDFSDLDRQMKSVAAGPGHLAVWIYSFPADPDSAQYDLWKAQLKTVLDYFTDVSAFPDGVTFLVNTQYSPSDQCPDPPGPELAPLSFDEEALLRRANQELFVDLATERSDTVTVDQYPDWLGHGWNAGVKGCPFCLVDSTLWQRDPIHPNAAGQEHIFQKWRLAVDRIYGTGCGNAG